MLLNGTSSRAETTGLGGVSGSSGATTIAAMIRRATAGTWDNIISIANSTDGTLLSMTIDDTNHLSQEVIAATSVGPALSPITGPMYVAVDRPAGALVTSRFHKQAYGTDATVAHSNAGTVNTESGTRHHVELGAFDGTTDWFSGDIYVAGVWNRQLADWEHDELAASIAAWFMSNPAWLIVELDKSLPTNIQDASGNGAPITTLTSLAVSTASLPVPYGGPLLSITHPAAGAGGTTFTISPGGVIAPVGTLAKLASKPLGGNATPTGAIAKLAAKALSGSTGPAGALAKMAAKVLGGGTSPAGALTRQAQKSATGSTTPTGTIARLTSKVLAGTTSPSGALRKLVAKTLTGATTPSGAVALAKVILLTLAGSIAPSGALRRQAQKALAAGITPTGSVRKTSSKTFGGNVTPTGALGKTISRLFAGTISPVGALARAVSSATAIAMRVVTRDWPMRAMRTRDASQRLASSDRPGFLLRATDYAARRLRTRDDAEDLDSRDH